MMFSVMLPSSCERCPCVILMPCAKGKRESPSGRDDLGGI
jgi:hypothetical protein